MFLPIFDIKRYSINDGPGIRITIFFKGCPLSCLWCHNPEGISPYQTKLYTLNRCIACRHCIKVCPQKALHEVKGKGIVTDFSKCISCGACAKVCPTRAMEMALKQYSVEKLMEEIEKERPFFETSGGGVTFCGGEPLLQRENLFPILEACGNAGIHRAVDTTLFADSELLLEVGRRCELFLVDLKHMDSQKHRRFCGVPNEKILSNIRLLASKGFEFIIRIPLIVGVNADEENLRASAQFLASLGITREQKDDEKRLNHIRTTEMLSATGTTYDASKCWRGPLVELLPYHDIAKGKHMRMGTAYNPDSIPMSTPSPDQLSTAQAIFAEYGVEARF